MNNQEEYIICINIYILFLLLSLSDQLSFSRQNPPFWWLLKVPGYSLCLQFYTAIEATAVADLCVKY